MYLKKEKFLITFSSYEQQTKSLADTNIFPMGCIISMEKITL